MRHLQHEGEIADAQGARAQGGKKAYTACIGETIGHKCHACAPHTSVQESGAIRRYASRYRWEPAGTGGRARLVGANSVRHPLRAVGADRRSQHAVKFAKCRFDGAKNGAFAERPVLAWCSRRPPSLITSTMSSRSIRCCTLFCGIITRCTSPFWLTEPVTAIPW